MWILDGSPPQRRSLNCHLELASRPETKSKRSDMFSKLRFTKVIPKLAQTNGASSVEFALIAPLLIMLIFAIFEFAIVYGDYLAIPHAAREGARLAAVGRFSEEVVRDRAYPVSPSAISVTYPSGNSHGEPVQVRVEYIFQLKIPFFGERTVPLASQASMRLEV